MSSGDGYVVVVPARAGSERVKHKNTRPFAGIEGGLLELKLRQLANVAEFDKIIVSSNDPAVLDYTHGFGRREDSRIVALERPDHLGVSSTPMSEFIKYAATLSDDGVMIMTHVTHPFVNAGVLSDILASYEAAIAAGHDSLVTVTELHKFIWDENGPYNYDATRERWPRSQDIKPLFEINHAAYVIPFALARDMGDRVGRKPFLHKLPESVALDIDWEDQFYLLQDIALAKQSRGGDLIG